MKKFFTFLASFLIGSPFLVELATAQQSRYRQDDRRESSSRYWDDRRAYSDQRYDWRYEDYGYDRRYDYRGSWRNQDNRREDRDQSRYRQPSAPTPTQEAKPVTATPEVKPPVVEKKMEAPVAKLPEGVIEIEKIIKVRDTGTPIEDQAAEKVRKAFLINNDLGWGWALTRTNIDRFIQLDKEKQQKAAKHRDWYAVMATIQWKIMGTRAILTYLKDLYIATKPELKDKFRDTIFIVAAEGLDEKYQTMEPLESLKTLVAYLSEKTKALKAQIEEIHKEMKANKDFEKAYAEIDKHKETAIKDLDYTLQTIDKILPMVSEHYEEKNQARSGAWKS